MIVHNNSNPMPVIMRVNPKDIFYWTDKVAQAQEKGRRDIHETVKFIYSAMQVEDIIADPELGRDELYFEMP